MIAAIVPFLYCMLLGSAWAIFFKKRFADSLAPAFMLHIIIVMLSGMLLHKLSVGIWGGMLLFAGVLACKLWKAPQDARAFLKTALPDGVFIFTIFYMFCFFMNYGKRFIFWDEYSHFGMFIKESLRLDALYAESPLPFRHKDYVPAATLFEVIWLCLSGRFLEADVFRALQMFGFSMLLPLLAYCPAEKQGKNVEGQGSAKASAWMVYQLVTVFLVMILVQACFVFREFNFYRSTTVDNALGAALLYCFVEAFRDYEGEEKYQALVLALGFSTLALMKQTGIALLAMVFAFFAIKRFLFQAPRPKGKEYVLALAALAAPVALWLGFNMFVSGVGTGTYENQSYSSVDYSSLFHVFAGADGNPIEHLGEFRGVFVNAVLTKDIVAHGSYALVIMCAAAAVFAASHFAEEGVKGKTDCAGWFIFVGGGGYATLMYVLYLTAFPPKRALELGSYDRYMATFAMFALLAVVFICHGMKIYRRHVVYYAAAAMSAYMFLGNAGMFSVILPEVLSNKTTSIARHEKIAEKIAGIVPENESVYIAHGSRYFFRRLRFYLHPMVVNDDNNERVSSHALGKSFTQEDLREKVNDHDWFYLSDLNEDFLSSYGGAFEAPYELKSMTLYKVLAPGEGKTIRLQEKAYIGSSGDKGLTALTFAAQKGREDIVRSLLSSGADVNVRDNNPGWTALIHAAYHGHADIVKLLLEHKANINDFSAKGATALMIAASKGREDVVQVLLEKGADITLRDKAGATALQRSVQAGHAEIEAMLQEAEAVKIGESWTELTHAAWSGRLDDVRTLIAKGADVNLHDKNPGWTPLMHAAFHGHTDIVKLLLEKGADAKASGKDDATAMQLAEQAGHTDIASVLREWVTVKEGKRQAALIRAAGSGRLEDVRALIAAGADVNLYDKKPGWTPLMHAAYHGHADIVKLLLEHKANINDFSAKGATALMIAASKGREDVVRVLLEKGADVTLRDKAGATALQRSVQARHTKIEAMLREAQGSGQR